MRQRNLKWGIRRIYFRNERSSIGGIERFKYQEKRAFIWGTKAFNERNKGSLMWGVKIWKSKAYNLKIEGVLSMERKDLNESNWMRFLRGVKTVKWEDSKEFNEKSKVSNLNNQVRLLGRIKGV